MAAQAGEAMRRGQWEEAERLWREVRRLDPNNAQAAFSLGVHAMRRGDNSGAVKLLEEAHARQPRDPFTLLTLAKARRSAGDDAGEGAAIDATLAVDPYYLPGLLAKAQRFERLGDMAMAAFYYRTALKLAPPEPHWPDVLRSQLAHAHTAFERHSKATRDRLDEALAPLVAALPADQSERWREAASILAGVSEPYPQQANQLYVPRLPAIPFFDRGRFPWAAALEAKTDVIRAELSAALLQSEGEFAPYIQLQPGQPVDQWATLNHSTRWSHYGLWRSGAPNDVRLARCPQTRAALEMVDLADIEGLCPNVMFSALAPHSHIPPHTGETNARIVAHLPLIVPPNCTYRVGFEHRQWREGELLFFDDTIEHEARNDSDQLRVVLIFDVWNPLLSLEERETVRRLAAAARGYQGDTP
ncbi:MAG: aspartyl/asparaginyl beta-hydroxylase domain-containing protein [Alphaproteobacteria bacterium]